MTGIQNSGHFQVSLAKKLTPTTQKGDKDSGYETLIIFFIEEGEIGACQCQDKASVSEALPHKSICPLKIGMCR